MRAVVAEAGGGLHVGGVGADLRLAQAERRQLLAARQRRQELAASAPRCPSARSPSGRSTGGADQDGRSMAQCAEMRSSTRQYAGVAEPAAAVFLRDGHAQHAEPAEAVDDLTAGCALRRRSGRRRLPP